MMTIWTRVDNILRRTTNLIASGPRTKTDIVAGVFAVGVGVLIVLSGAELADKLIGVFGVLAVVLRLDSRVSFVLALIMLIDIPIFQALNRPSIAENLAVFAFYFLLIGVIGTLLESQPEREYREVKSRLHEFEPIAKVNRTAAPASSGAEESQPRASSSEEPVVVTPPPSSALPAHQQSAAMNMPKSSARVIQTGIAARMRKTTPALEPPRGRVAPRPHQRLIQ
jgi:hypothetical protein